MSLLLSLRADMEIPSNVLFILEVDENQHRYILPGCELKRLQELQERHSGPLFVIRYNPDQENGLGDEMLSNLAQRCEEVLDGEYALAEDAFGGIYVEYYGYSGKRLECIDRAWFESQETDE
jgi:hypothetical protein